MPDPTLSEIANSLAILPGLIQELTQELRNSRIVLAPASAPPKTADPKTKGDTVDSFPLKYKGITREKLEKFTRLLLQGLLNNSVYDVTGIGRQGVDKLIGADGKKDLIRRVITPLIDGKLLIRQGQNVKLPKNRSTVLDFLKSIEPKSGDSL
jgi:hypothetical protein